MSIPTETKESMRRRHAAGAPAASKNRDLRTHPILLCVKQREGGARLATPVRGAPGIEQHEIVFVFEEGDVRVAEDDHAGVREAASQARPATFPGPGIVDHRYLCATQLESSVSGRFECGGSRFPRTAFTGT